MNDRKVLCFRKSIGTPFAVYQIKAGSKPGELQYQIAAPVSSSSARATTWGEPNHGDGGGGGGGGGGVDWYTLSVPNFWTRPNVTTRVTVVHDGAEVSIYRNSTMVLRANMSRLDYDDAEAMVVGWRKGDEFWLGEIGPVSIKVGAFPPSVVSTDLRGVTALPASEVAALADIYNNLGGRFWMYRR